MFEIVKGDPIDFDYGILEKFVGKVTPILPNLPEDMRKILETEYLNSIWSFNYDITSDEMKFAPRFYPVTRAIKSMSRKFDYPHIYEMIKERVSIVNNAGVLFQGNGTGILPDRPRIFEHYHPSDGPTKRTVTLIAPIRIVEEITETVCFNYHPELDQVESQEEWIRNCLNTKVEGEVIKCKFPDIGEYLILDFDSTHYLHWVEGITNNHYLIFVFDSVCGRVPESGLMEQS